MLIVDTYNVLHHPLAHRELPHDAGAAGRRPSSPRAGTGEAGPSSCDGMPRNMGPMAHRALNCGSGRARVIYAGPGRDADSLIERLIEAEHAPKRMSVVSSDRRLQKAARRRRARVIPSDDFLRSLIRDVDRGKSRWLRPAFTTEVPLSPSAIRYWKDLFRIDEADLPLKPLSRGRRLLHPLPDERPKPKAIPTPNPGPSQSQSPPRSLRPRPSRTPSRSTRSCSRRPQWRGRLSLDDLDMTKWLGD